ncbi:MAG TPA: hypothetical protein VN920_08885 [Pyrinomonadaceae bacterium]|nr:hypothetical protein [Pyrinomonadaceae bacterium]
MAIRLTRIAVADSRAFVWPYENMTDRGTDKVETIQTSGNCRTRSVWGCGVIQQMPARAKSATGGSVIERRREQLQHNG